MFDYSPPKRGRSSSPPPTPSKVVLALALAWATTGKQPESASLSRKAHGVSYADIAKSLGPFAGACNYTSGFLKSVAATAPKGTEGTALLKWTADTLRQNGETLVRAYCAKNPPPVPPVKE